MTHLLSLNHSVKPWVVPNSPYPSFRPYWCDFYGVYCPLYLEGLTAGLTLYQPITEIYLVDMPIYVYGTLPSEISYLTKLRVLEISNNYLYGDIPQGITACTDLRILNLRGNQLSGTLPETLNLMTDLVYLNLSSNSLTGGIPSTIGLMSDITSLSLGNNKIGSTIPSEITHLTNLRHISLGDNNLIGIIPDNIGQLKDLTTLDLSNNRLAYSIPPQMALLSTLEYFNISTNFLTSGRGEFPDLDQARLPPQAVGASFDFCNNCFIVFNTGDAFTESALKTDTLTCTQRLGCYSSAPTQSPTFGKKKIKHDSNTKHDILTEENFFE